ncbi:hypothetical protein ACFL1H_04880 [Nanoarchaeota archaeon]
MDLKELNTWILTIAISLGFVAIGGHLEKTYSIHKGWTIPWQINEKKIEQGYIDPGKLKIYKEDIDKDNKYEMILKYNDKIYYMKDQDGIKLEEVK